MVVRSPFPCCLLIALWSHIFFYILYKKNTFLDNPTTTYICEDEEPVDGAEKVEREKDDLWTDYYYYGDYSDDGKVQKQN